MMEQEAIVASVDGDHAYIKVGSTGGGCGRCQERGGCQSSILGQLFRSKPRLFRIANPIGAAPGDHVVVRMAEGAMLHAAILIYALPLMCLLLGAGVGTVLAGDGNSDAATALGALAGFAFGVLSGLTLRRAAMGKVAQPVLVRHRPTFPMSEESCL
jgi:sigma-E factor negative regulatory protein RseC